MFIMSYPAFLDVYGWKVAWHIARSRRSPLRRTLAPGVHSGPCFSRGLRGHSPGLSPGNIQRKEKTRFAFMKFLSEDRVERHKEVEED